MADFVRNNFEDYELKQPNRVTFHEFSSAFIFLVVGFIVSGVCFLAELCWYRRSGRVGQKERPAEKKLKLHNSYHFAVK